MALKNTHLSRPPQFVISDAEYARFDDWAATKPQSNDTIGTQFTFEFTPTSLGMIVAVRCAVTKEKLVLTDFSTF
jgi:hypothetical protein